MRTLMTDRGKRQTVLIVILLVCATLVTYGNSIRNGFVWDDHGIIVNNDANKDFSHIAELFSSADSTTTGNQKTYYRPLNRLTYMLDYQMFGLRPAGYHVENIVIHAMTVVLLYFLAYALFGDAIPAFIASILFAVHPVNSEAVNFISARNTLLSTLFILLSALSYLRAETANKSSYLLVSGLSFFLGLLCKEPTFMLPLVLFAYGHMDGRAFAGRIKARIVSFVPFLFSAAAYLLLRSHALQSITGESRILPGLGERLAHNIYIIPQYASIILLPLRLNALYSIPQQYLVRPLWLFSLWIIIISVFWVAYKRSAAAKFGLIWLVVNFLPISNVVPIPSAPMAERYLYLPVIGAWIIAADLIYGLYKHWPYKKPLAVAGAALVLCLVPVTVYRNFDWKDDLRFYSRLAQTNPDSALAHYSLGLAYWERNEIERAQEEWMKTANIDPRYFNVLGRLGESYVRMGSFDQAEHYYSREAEINPEDALALYNLAVIKEKLNKPQEAVRYYEQFIALKPPAYAAILPSINAKIDLLKAQLRSSRDPAVHRSQAND